MTAGDNLLKALVNSVYWLTIFVQKFYSVFYIIGLGGILFVFSVAGGWIFQIVEAPIENSTIQTLVNQRTSTVEQFRTKIRNKERKSDVELYVQEYEYVYTNAITDGIIIEDGKSKPLWTLKGAIYYCVTTYTLIGFGNLAPRTNLGRLIAIFYSGISIPVGTLILGELGDFIVRGLKCLYILMLKCCRCGRKPKPRPKKEAELNEDLDILVDEKATDRKKSREKKRDKRRSGREGRDKRRSDKEGRDKRKSGKRKTDKEKSDRKRSDKDKSSKKRSDKEKSDKKKSDKGKSDKKKSDKGKSDKKKSDKEKTDKKKSDKGKSDKKKSSREKSKKTKSKSKNKSANNKENDDTDSSISDQDSTQWQAQAEADKVQKHDLEWTLNMCRYYREKKKQNLKYSDNSNRCDWGGNLNSINTVGLRREPYFIRLSKSVEAIPKAERNEQRSERKDRAPMKKREVNFRNGLFDMETKFSNNIRTSERIKEQKTSTIIRAKDIHQSSESSECNFVYVKPDAKLCFIENSSNAAIGFVRRRNVFNGNTSFVAHVKTNSTKHTFSKIEETKRPKGHRKKNCSIIPPTYTSLLILASPFKWFFVGNVIRKVLHKVMRSLEKQNSVCTQSTAEKPRRNVENNATTVPDKQGCDGESHKTILNSQQSSLKTKSGQFLSSSTYGSVCGGNISRNSGCNDICRLGENKKDRSNNNYPNTSSREEKGYDNATKGGEDTSKSASSKEKKDVEEMPQEEEEEEDEEGAPVMATVIVTCVYIISGSVALANFSENLKILESVWFLYISMVTIGYGDITPPDQLLFTIILPYIFIGLSLMSSVLNDVTSYFTNNVIRARNIAQEVQQIITTTHDVQVAVQKRQRARARWDFVRATVWKGHLPERLVEEAKWNKINVFAKERELIRRAYMIYFHRPPCPEGEQEGAEIDYEGNIIPQKGGFEAVKAIRRLFSRHTESTFDEYLNKYFTLWQRFRRWVVRKFYEIREYMTGESIPPESSTTYKRTVTLGRNEPVYVEENP